MQSSTLQPRCLSNFIGNNDAKNLQPSGSQVASTLAIAAAAIFTVAGAATNLIYGISKGVDLPTSIVWGAVAVAASIGLALAPSAFLLSLGTKRYSAAGISLVAALIFGAYSVTAALGSATGGRMVAASEATEIADSRVRYQAAHAIASTELDQLASARPSGELAAEINAIDSMPGIIIEGVPCGGTLNGKVTKEWCPKRSELAAEAARAQRQEKLQADMAAATAALAKLPSTRVANADATALKGFLDATGHSLSADALNKFLVVLAVLVIEFGGGLALALAMALRDGGQNVSGPIVDGAPKDVVSGPAETPVAAVDPVSAPTVKKPRKRTRNKHNGGRGGPGSGGQRMPANVIDLLRAKGGRIDGGQRGIGELIGVGKSRVNEILHELAAAGSVILSTSKAGTSVRLAAA